MQRILLIFSLSLSLLSFSAIAHTAEIKSSTQCKNQAIKQAAKLLEFHFGPDERIEIQPEVKALPSIINPGNKKQRFDVLEVWGYIYKGQYRMRFEYFSQSDCILMGQEILEYASL